MKRPFSSIFVALLAVAFAGGCGGSPAPISVSLSPASAQTDQGQTVTITATLTNDISKDGVDWNLSGPGSLSSQSGGSTIYSAPATVTAAVTATITATSVADPTRSKTIQVVVNPAPQITLQQPLPSGTTGTAYSQTVTETGGTAPFTWAVFFGAVPDGLSLAPGTGAISGTPSGGGTWNFTLQLTDAAGLSTFSGGLDIAIVSNVAGGNPVPFVNQPLVPDAAAPGGAALTLTVNGSGFVSNATVDFNGAPLPTTFVSSQQLTATVAPANIASAGTASITVVNPTPGGGRSNAAFFPVAAPEPTLSFSYASGSPISVDIVDTALQASDFNGDGKTDLAVVGDPSIVILLSNGDGTFTPASGSPISTYSPQQGTDPLPSAVVAGDFNNDGKLDVAVADGGYLVNNVPILFGNSDGTFTASTGPGTTGDYTSCSMAAGDFNGDGNLDLAVTNDIYGSMAILLGYGDGAFSSAAGSPVPIPVNSCFLAVGDFNRDGKLDLVITNGNSATLTVMLGNGDGTFTQATGSPIAVGNGPDAVAVGDFNGDGKLDLAVANFADNTVTILLGNGDGTFTAASGSPIPVGSAPDAIVLGDFLGNGKLDLAVANSASNNVTLLLGNGDGTFTEAASSPFPVGNGPTSLAVGDFNGDGRLDLAVTNATDGTVSILLQQ